MRGLVAAVAALLLAGGCTHIPGLASKGTAAPSASSAVNASGTPLAKATGVLDAEVPMPSGFPTDVPIYPKARLTAGASFTSPGQLTWGMEWETADATSAVRAYYEKQFATGDWTFKVTNDTSSVLAGTIARKSDPNVKGVLTVNADITITMIDLSLVSAA